MGYDLGLILPTGFDYSCPAFVCIETRVQRYNQFFKKAKKNSSLIISVLYLVQGASIYIYRYTCILH